MGETLQMLEKYPKNAREYLIPILQDIQQKQGFLPSALLPQVAIHVGLPLVKIYSVATYYNQFRLQPTGKYHIQVCTGCGCHLEAGSSLLRELMSLLDICDGEVTHDQMFSLETVPCLGVCHLSPAICINGEIFGNMKTRGIYAVLDSLRRQDHV